MRGLGMCLGKGRWGGTYKEDMNWSGSSSSIEGEGVDDSADLDLLSMSICWTKVSRVGRKRTFGPDLYHYLLFQQHPPSP